MGGSPEMFEIADQISNLKNDLNTLNFIIFFSSGRNSLFDSYKLRDSLATEMEDFFKRNHIKSNNWGDVGLGGGGMETFLEILKELWRNKDLIAFILSTLRFLNGIYLRYLAKKARISRPRATMLLILESEAIINKLNKSELNSILSNYISNLLYISTGLSKFLSQNHPFILIDITIEIRINKIKYNFVINLPDGDQTELKITRLINIIQNIRIKNNLNSTYSFGPLNLLQRIDRTTNNKLTKYYLIYSSNILADVLFP